MARHEIDLPAANRTNQSGKSSMREHDYWLKPVGAATVHEVGAIVKDLKLVKPPVRRQIAARGVVGGVSASLCNHYCTDERGGAEFRVNGQNRTSDHTIPFPHGPPS
jgi:hypothetical protein